MSARVDTPEEAARVANAHWRLGRRSSLVLANAPAESLDDVEPLIEAGLEAARAEGVTGHAVTPYVLAYLHDRSGGRTLEANKRLIADNAGLAAEVAVAYARR